MNSIKIIIILAIFVSNLYSQPILNQKRNFKINRNNSVLESINILNNSIEPYETYGSPFNNIDNPQIDSVIILISTPFGYYDTVKFFYEYDSRGNVAVETKQNYYNARYTYDDDGNRTVFLWQIWENDQWVNYGLANTDYDSSGKKIFGTFQLWDTDHWQNYTQATYLYNSDNELDYFLREEWKNNSWINSFREIYTYDSSNKVLSIISQNWGDGEWNGTTWKIQYTYDSKGNNIVQLIPILVNNKWQNSVRWRYEFDKRNNNIFAFYDNWDVNRWINSIRWRWNYDDNDNVVWYLEEYFENGKWIKTLQTFSSYNSEGYFISSNTEQWLEQDSLWIPGNEFVFIYDADGNRRDYAGSQIRVYYHSNISNIKNEPEITEEYYLSQNYPNPFNPITNIMYSVVDNSHRENIMVSLKIYNLLGQEVATLVNAKQNPGNYEVKFDASLLPSGIFIYKLSYEGYSMCRKMVLLK